MCAVALWSLILLVGYPVSQHPDQVLGSEHRDYAATAVYYYSTAKLFRINK